MQFDKSENVLIAIAWIGHKIDDTSPVFEQICKDFNFDRKVISKNDKTEMQQQYPLTKDGEPVCINELAHLICGNTEQTQVLYFEDW